MYGEFENAASFIFFIVFFSKCTNNSNTKPQRRGYFLTVEIYLKYRMHLIHNHSRHRHLTLFAVTVNTATIFLEWKSTHQHFQLVEMTGCLRRWFRPIPHSLSDLINRVCKFWNRREWIYWRIRKRWLNDDQKIKINWQKIKWFIIKKCIWKIRYSQMQIYFPDYDPLS